MLKHCWEPYWYKRKLLKKKKKKTATRRKEREIDRKEREIERQRWREGRHPDLLPSSYSQSKVQTHYNFCFSSYEYSLFSLPFEFS